jgi:hypothetical protein
MSSNVCDLNRERAKRDYASIVRVINPDARKARARKLLLSWLDEHADLGAEFLLSELSGATVAVEAFHDMTKE